MTDHLRRIREHMALETKALLLAAERARLFDNSTNRGSEAEDSIRHWLRARFAPEFVVSSGEVIDSFDTNANLKSRQQDGILHRNIAEANRFVLPSGMRLVPIETVAAVVEVKLTLDREEFFRADAAAAITAKLRLRPRIKGLLRRVDDRGEETFSKITEEHCKSGIAITDEAFEYPPTVFALFAFGGIKNLLTIKEWMGSDSTISLVCCLEAGCVDQGGAAPVGHFYVEPRGGSVDADADSSLWHFSEALARAIDRHQVLLKDLDANYDQYAPYPRIIMMPTTHPIVGPRE